jgi:Uma2 family endonuclease
MALTVASTPLTYAEYLALPEMKARYSIVDGALVIAAAPTPHHQRVVQRTFVRLDAFVQERQLGTVFLAPLDVVIRRDPLRTRQPDVMFISDERSLIIGQQVIEGGPDLVIEILSPANTRWDLEEKLRDYQAIDVREAWVVATQGQTVEVLQLSLEHIQRSGLYGLGDRIVSQVLPELQLTVDALFPEV